MQGKINDINAICKGAHFFFQDAGTVIDVGVEEVRIARLDKDGNVVDFAINEKCAAGTGAFIESMARALEISLEDMGSLALSSDKMLHLNSQCAIFAELEVVGLIHAKTELKDICRAIHEAMASRIVSMIRRMVVNKEVVMIGGVAYNPGFIEAMKRQIGVEKIFIPENPEFGAAAGAALFGYDLCRKKMAERNKE